MPCQCVSFSMHLTLNFFLFTLLCIKVCMGLDCYLQTVLFLFPSIDLRWGIFLQIVSFFDIAVFCSCPLSSSLVFCVLHRTCLMLVICNTCSGLCYCLLLWNL